MPDSVQKDVKVPRDPVVGHRTNETEVKSKVAKTHGSTNPLDISPT